MAYLTEIKRENEKKIKEYEEQFKAFHQNVTNQANVTLQNIDNEMLQTTTRMQEEIMQSPFNITEIHKRYEPVITPNSNKSKV